MKRLSTLILLLSTIFGAQAQCEFDPVVEGEVIFCPGESGDLTTQEYDEYQWYRRGFFDDIATLVEGETSQTITVPASDILFYYSVECTLDGCTEISPEVLIDGWTFLPVTVATFGDFTTGNNGEFVVCDGDEITMEIMLPYNTNITWFQNGIPMPGEEGTELIVDEPGEYWVSGAPDICPNFVQTLGVVLEVEFVDCSPTDIGEVAAAKAAINMFPNPAKDQLTLDNPGSSTLDVSILNGLGQQILSTVITSERETISLSGLESGVYSVAIQSEFGVELKRLVIR